MTAGTVTGGSNGRRLKIEKPIAGDRACGAASRLLLGMVLFWSTCFVQRAPNCAVKDAASDWSSGPTCAWMVSSSRASTQIIWHAPSGSYDVLPVSTACWSSAVAFALMMIAAQAFWSKIS